ncbi:MAG: DHH family phosphoesterase [Synergistaceae bacterium]|nr:DHH family phosphoesterase [Synergistaceae bacterium]
MPTCSISNLRIHEIGDLTRDLAKKLSCPELTAAVLEMLHESRCTDADAVQAWLRPRFEALMEELNLGMGSTAAAEKWHSRGSFGNVVVYGDYDTDGVSSTVLAMEIFRHKALGVRYYIPRRDMQGYGLHANILDQLAAGGCNTLVVVDCGTNDEEMLYACQRRALDVFVFDHHSVSVPSPSFPFTVNPCVDGDETARKLCATAVLWCWAWKGKIVSRSWLSYALDLAALATVADCMPLHVLNRAIVQKGLALMRHNPRRGLSALFEKLGVTQHTLSEEQLSMRIIPCLNAPGRVGYADPSVKALLGVGEFHSHVDDLIRANKKRQTLSERIVSEIDDFSGKRRHVMFGAAWPVGVLSGVASRICSLRKSPVVLAAPVGGKIRGTLRVPEGANAVGILSSIAGQLDAWGGHRHAAGFSVLSARWAEVEENLEELLSQVQVEEDVVKALALSPARITLKDWKAVGDLGPFGNDNPCPYFYRERGAADKVVPLGKDGKHCAVVVDEMKLLAFNAASDLENVSGITGWLYHPRLDYWRDEERVQFMLDCAVAERGAK